MNKPVRGALAIGALAVATSLVWLFHGSEARKQPIDCKPLVQLLQTAQQPQAAIVHVEQAATQGDGCNYAEVAGRAALDADLHQAAEQLLDKAPRKCPRAPILDGQRAEALARAAHGDRAEPLALAALKLDPQNPYAELALARISYDKNQMASCSDYADKALMLGRGGEAERLLGRSALARGQYKEAEAHFQKLLTANPKDPEAAFSAAICNDKLGHYMLAREGFLQTLHINPKHQMARSYLVVLTHNAGFNDEARHHLAKLGEVIPEDSPVYQQLAQLVDGNPGADAGAPDAGAPKPGTVQGKR
ncbi:MAG TPA: tetratricopeptide repeat protein [Polyangiaceae bacterium]